MTRTETEYGPWLYAMSVLAIWASLLSPVSADEVTGGKVADKVASKITDDKVTEDKITGLIQQLDSETFAEREEASLQLLKIGRPAIPQLKIAARHGSPETRFRATEIIRQWQRPMLVNGFKQLGKAKTDPEIDVEQGMFLIAFLIDPEVSKADLTRELDELAAKVRLHLGDKVVAKNLPPKEAVAAIRAVLFDDLGFTGNEDDYDNPINSSLAVVLKTRKGLPILLSHVVCSVAQRLEIPIVGIGISGRYMCKYHGADAPGGPSEDIVIDPFGGGRVLTKAQMKEDFHIIDPDAYAPHPNRDTVNRMMNNLASDYEHQGHHRDAALVRSLKTYLWP